MATDIAFAVGVLALIGPMVPQRLKLFLLTLAIVDDIGAILVIAVFYTADLHFGWLAVAFLGLVWTVILKRLTVWYIPVYVIIGVVTWYATLQSGVHATIAGVSLGLLAPATPLLRERTFEGIEDVLSGDSAVSSNSARDANWRIKETVPITNRLTGIVSPWSSFLIVPVFALANAGIELSGAAFSNAISSRVALGVVVGLVVGKPAGVALATWLGLRSGLTTLPEGLTMRHVLGGGAVAGIGFTVALFISKLAFVDADGNPSHLLDEAIMGVLIASVMATIVGWLVLRSASPPVED